LPHFKVFISIQCGFIKQKPHWWQQNRFLPSKLEEFISQNKAIIFLKQNDPF
jgi:hypothetical protein